MSQALREAYPQGAVTTGCGTRGIGDKQKETASRERQMPRSVGIRRNGLLSRNFCVWIMNFRSEVARGSDRCPGQMQFMRPRHWSICLSDYLSISHPIKGIVHGYTLYPLHRNTSPEHTTRPHDLSAHTAGPGRTSTVESLWMAQQPQHAHGVTRTHSDTNSRRGAEFSTTGHARSATAHPGLAISGDCAGQQDSGSRR